MEPADSCPDTVQTRVASEAHPCAGRLDLFTREFVYHGDDGLSQLVARKRQRCPAGAEIGAGC